MAILMVEDDERIIEFVKRGLKAEGYLVDVARNGKEAMQMAVLPRYELVILDLMLPDMSGQDICRRLRGPGNKDSNSYANGNGHIGGEGQRVAHGCR